MAVAGKPPYAITTEILSRVEQIGEAIGRAEAAGVGLDLHLRREARVRTVHGSVAIEGNALSEEQVSAILDGKRIVGPFRDIQEVRNANAAYGRRDGWAPSNEADLLEAHGVLMAGLAEAPGRYRTRQVGVVGSGAVHHIGPPAGRVPGLMADLLAWLGRTQEQPLVRSSVFHYEFEFIHPFEDGNGRLGRLWQTLVLARWKPLFAHVPVESVVRARQSAYYEAIERSSAAGESTPFIGFMLEAILDAVRDAAPQEPPQVSPQVRRLLHVMDGEMSRRDILEALGLRDRKWLRQGYLGPALQAGLIEMTRPRTPSARNQRYRLTRAARRLRGQAAGGPGVRRRDVLNERSRPSGLPDSRLTALRRRHGPARATGAVCPGGGRAGLRRRH